MNSGERGERVGPMRCGSGWVAVAAVMAAMGCIQPGDLAVDDDSAEDPTPGPAELCDPDGDHIDLGALNGAVDWIEQNPNHIDSFVVQHCNGVVVENYDNGFDATTPHELQSATKTFTAALIGIAIDQGLIEGVEQPLAELLPEHAHLLTGPKAEITLEHALTMTTGLRWVDFGVNNSFEQIGAAVDSVAFILEEPLDTMPGEIFFYNTGSSHLLSAIIHNNSGTTTALYAEQYLFGPLGITDYQWPALQDGVNQGGWGMYMRPLDFIKLGQLFLDEGQWDGQPIISQAYVDEATAYQVSNNMGGGYGYQMWIDTNTFDVDDIAGARGYGGQDCLVLEDLHMAVVFTGNIDYPAQMAADVTTLMNEHVIPSHADAVGEGGGR